MLYIDQCWLHLFCGRQTGTIQTVQYSIDASWRHSPDMAAGSTAPQYSMHLMHSVEHAIKIR